MSDALSDTLTLHSLLAANERFYRTFERLDYPALAALWEQSARTFCVHPGWPPLAGAPAVMDSWRRIIDNTAQIRFSLSGAQGFLSGDTGVVTVFETIDNILGDERSTSGTIATNLFSFDPQRERWMLFHHHASHCLFQPEDAEGPLLV